MAAPFIAVGTRAFLAALTLESAAAVREASHEIIRESVDIIADVAIPLIPVDTGKARGSVVVQSSSRSPLTSPTLDKNGSRTRAAIKSAIRTYLDSSQDIVEAVYIDAIDSKTGGRLPYMERLEAGYSPKGRAMFETALAAVNARFPD